MAITLDHEITRVDITVNEASRAFFWRRHGGLEKFDTLEDQRRHLDIHANGLTGKILSENSHPKANACIRPSFQLLIREFSVP